MTDKTVKFFVRLPPSVDDRIGAAAAALSSRAMGASVSKSDVARMALEKGLEVIERDLGSGTMPTPATDVAPIVTQRQTSAAPSVTDADSRRQARMERQREATPPLPTAGNRPRAKNDQELTERVLRAVREKGRIPAGAIEVAIAQDPEWATEAPRVPALIEQMIAAGTLLKAPIEGTALWVEEPKGGA